ncbi:hypothetical protein [Phytohabitans rumicis]|uniref:MmgE/PrpD family protein n=1 Tax=Phytohabitans rumicis TaxID=1076125 RepID=A0A6V8KWJ9_9ACTN|nr:hypothetical protein [Phytohabitans rumicis]GFJ86771.1 hypothetical protein Prum_004130 [Phytohabitans rumicis]
MPDARAAALAAYLYQCAAAFSLSADVSDAHHVARAGMALLDAARLAETLRPTDHRLTALSEAGCFETMPDKEAVFLEPAGLRAAILRPLSGGQVSGNDILSAVVAAARAT